MVSKSSTFFFDKIRPSIVMIGPWDDYFTIIRNQYKWAEHFFSPPGRIAQNTTLIIVNNRHYFNLVASMTNDMDSKASIIVYDDTEIIPIEERNIEDRNICFLRASSPRYINGHIRSMLQLQRWMISDQHEYPLILTDPIMLQNIRDILITLDKGLPINIITGNAYYFFLMFKTMAAKTHYYFSQYIDSIDNFDSSASHEFTTIFIKINSKEEYQKYLKKPLMEYVVVFISDFEIKEKHITETFDMQEITKSKSDFFLSAYYFSIKNNLIDKNNRTRFVQSGDLSKLYDQSEDFIDFYEKLKDAHKQKTLTLKNIAPMIRGVNYGLHPLNLLIDHLVGAIYKEFFEQSNYVLEHAEMVSSVKRSTLQPRLEKILKRAKKEPKAVPFNASVKTTTTKNENRYKFNIKALKFCNNAQRKIGSQ